MSDDLWIGQIMWKHQYLMVWLTYCSLINPYGDVGLSQIWLKLSLVAWRYQFITYTHVDLS